MIDGQGDRKMRIARSASSRFLLATLCCLSLHTVGEANAAAPQAKPAQPSAAAAEALRKRGHAAYDAGQFAEALRHYDEAYRLDPNDASILMLRGGTYKELGRCKEAIADFDAFERQHNDIADFLLIGNVFVNRAYCRMQLKDYAAAVGDLEDQVRYKPDDDWAWAELGRAYGFLKRYEESEEALKRAIELNPDGPFAHYQLAVLLFDVGAYPRGNSLLENHAAARAGQQGCERIARRCRVGNVRQACNRGQRPGHRTGRTGAVTQVQNIGEFFWILLAIHQGTAQPHHFLTATLAVELHT